MIEVELMETPLAADFFLAYSTHFSIPLLSQTHCLSGFDELKHSSPPLFSAISAAVELYFLTLRDWANMVSIELGVGKNDLLLMRHRCQNPSLERRHQSLVGQQRDAANA
nr:MAG: hypothetical protein EDM05_22685 [Leptolyngbya sp. IPPAS B-1204]